MWWLAVFGSNCKSFACFPVDEFEETVKSVESSSPLYCLCQIVMNYAIVNGRLTITNGAQRFLDSGLTDFLNPWKIVCSDSQTVSERESIDSLFPADFT